jgi:cytoskeletal protein CcmA (bactofilin family)
MGDASRRRLLDSMGEPATIIGRDTEFVGALSGPGHVLVRGVVRGDSVLAGSVTVAEGGQWLGALRAADIVVAGSIDGDVSAADRIEIRPTARIRGSVSAGRIAIGQGAVVEGDLRTAAASDVHRFEEKRGGRG